MVSVTRVEMPEDLMTARIFISVMGTEPQQRNALRALQHASGRIQELMMKKISLRNTPHLEFVEDKTFKKTLETYTLIQKAMQEIREKEEKAKQDAPQSPDEHPADDASKPPEQEEQE